jgi:16S rRNA (uracil1498-N3)-methyltransferase
MSEPLFYHAALGQPGDTLALAGDEAHHALAVRRLRVTDALWLFDGRGGLAQTRITAIDSKRRTLTLAVETLTHTPAPQPRLTLACALPKGERQGVLLDMATQLGMQRFIPLQCERGVVSPGPQSAQRWARICLEACKQSRRLILPTIEAPATPAAVAQRCAPVLMAHPGGTNVREALTRCASNAEITLMIGPEGGFTDAEVQAVRDQGGQLVSLGTAILRIETAAVALLVAVQNG